MDKTQFTELGSCENSTYLKEVKKQYILILQSESQFNAYNKIIDIGDTKQEHCVDR